MNTDMNDKALGVWSEVGQLRRVLVHRPDLSLRRLTPGNCRDLLFDDVLWVKRAREEHDVFVDALRDRGVEVLQLRELLAETLNNAEARSWLLDRVASPMRSGVSMLGEMRAWLEALSSADLSRLLIGGLAKAEAPFSDRGLTGLVTDAHDFILPPLPNHLFTRDTSCWIYNGVSLNPMAKHARKRETLNYRAIYRFHPMFTGGGHEIWFGSEERDYADATIEGGDVMPIGNSTVLVGMGERTTPQAVECLAQSLFDKAAARRVIAAAFPRARSAMHLDTVFTMVDRDKVTCYPEAVESFRTWSLRPGDSEGAMDLREEEFPGRRVRRPRHPAHDHSHRRRQLRGRARAVGRRQQHPGRRARRRDRLRPQRLHQHPAAQSGCGSDHDPRIRVVPRPRRRPLHELPDPTPRHLKR